MRFVCEPDLRNVDDEPIQSEAFEHFPLYLSLGTGKMHAFKTRMHSSRVRTVRCSGHLSCQAHPPTTHAPIMQPPVMHAPPILPCTPRILPCMPPLTMHAPLCHTCPPFATHAPHGQTDTCENIIFPQLLLRTVIRHYDGSFGD